jgi:hypothetical protein
VEGEETGISRSRLLWAAFEVDPCSQFVVDEDIPVAGDTPVGWDVFPSAFDVFQRSEKTS